MALAWRANDNSGGCDSGGEAIEMKRSHMMRLEGNNGDSKGREEGTKMRAAVVVAACVDGVANDKWSATEVLGSTSKGRQQPLRRPEGEVEEAATSAWGVTNGDCGYGCCDPREAIAGLGRRLLVLLRSRAGDVVGQ
ncbi:hypothetical protein GW17_00030346 [Ensete ventricosum]|nr:hypothetical protein GW17_00030346 [Ensete ventricosum]